MASRAEKAAAMRAKILARSKDRMATVSGEVPAAHVAPSHGDAASAAPAAEASGTLSAADADAALDAALSEIGTASTAAPDASAASASGEHAAPESIPVADDPHEFPSSADVAVTRRRAAGSSHDESQQLLSPSSFFGQAGAGGGSDSDMAFRAFASAAQAMQQHPASAAAERRRQKDAAAAAAFTELHPLQQRSALQRWQARVSEQIKDTPRARIVTVGAVLLTGALAGLGHLEGGVLWLLLVQLVVRSASFLYTRGTSRKSASSRSAASAASSRPAPSPPPMDSPDADSDVLELDTDVYARRKAQADAAAAGPFGALAQGMGGFPGFPGGASGSGGLNLSALGLPPALDTALSGVSLLLKYGALMKQLLHDAMLFLFVCVLTNAALQIARGDAHHMVYVQA